MRVCVGVYVTVCAHLVAFLSGEENFSLFILDANCMFYFFSLQMIIFVV
jgi:hypothetical protein